MQFDFKGSTSHVWITILWCAFGAFILGAIAVISYWIRKCRINDDTIDNRHCDPNPSESNTPNIYSAKNRDTTGQPQHNNNNNNNNSQYQKQKDQSFQHHQQQQQQSSPPPISQQQQQQRSVSILVYKTLNTVFKSSRKIIFRVCEVASAKKSLKMFNLYSSMKNRGDGGNEPTTGHDRFCQTRVTNRPKRRKSKNVRRTNSANEIDHTVLTAAARRQLFSSHRSASSDLENSDHSEHSEKSPLVSVRLDSLAKIFFNKSTTSSTNGTTNRDSIDSTTTRPNVKYQYTALDSGNGIQERSPRERAARDRALSACQQWTQNTNGRYDIIAHLDEIGSRHNKNWFLMNDTTVRTDRLMTLLPLPPDCIALEELPPSETPKGLFMELLGSLHHPYIYPVLDLGFLHTDSINYACLVMPFNPRGSLKDLIYKAQWNEPWSRKYTRKPTCLPISQVQRLGRQILEALLFLRERGFPLHGHLHSGNVILQNGVARLTGLENGLLGLSSRVNAVMWSRSISDIDNIDIICFGHLLYEMVVGSELNTPQPSTAFLEMELDRYPQILEILQLIFEPQNGCNVTVEDLVLCDLFRNIDLRELRGPCVSTIKPSLSKSTLNLLQAVKKRQTASLGESLSEASSPCTPPSTPRDRRTGTADSFDISSDSDGGLDEVVITSSSYDSHHYDPLNSPIHFCDNSIQSDDNSAGGGSSCSNIIAISATSSSTSPRPTDMGGGEFEMVHCPCTSMSSSALNNQLTTDICNYKNSKSRRLEYSLRCLKYGRSNPSQDSAFGSLTDGELSVASSSFRLSSFQSIGSPIDEGVEDMIVATTVANETSLELKSGSARHQMNNRSPSPMHTQIHLDSAISDVSSSSSHLEGSPTFTSSSCTTDESSNRSHSHAHFHHSHTHHNNFSLSPSPRKCTADSPSPSNFNQQSLQFDPPKILVNDQNSIYTTSPSKRSATIEVFSQKYRVSSFEDMTAPSPQGRKHLKSVSKITFRSLEDERRIDNAFQPIRDRTHSENRVYNVNNSEKYKKLTHTSFSNRISNAGSSSRESNLHAISSPNPPPSPSSPRDRHTLWRESIFYRKNKIAKSNDSLLETTPSPKLSPSRVRGDSYELRKALNRGKSVNEIASCTKRADSEDFLTGSLDHSRIDSRKSRSERHLFSLGKLKQTAIGDCFSEDEISTSTHFHDNKLKRLSLASNSINRQNAVCVNFSNISIFQSCEESPMEESFGTASSQETSPLRQQQQHQNHQSVCRIIGGVDDPPSSSEEKTPLLESMELSQISPTDSESEPPL